jgi:hypothetical protein
MWKDDLPNRKPEDTGKCETSTVTSKQRKEAKRKKKEKNIDDD